jgi:predicted nucleic acid-binding protein
MDSTVFADTSFFIARVWPRDPHHVRAETWERYLAGRGVSAVTTEAVLWEFLAGRQTRALAIEAYRAIHRDPSIKVLGFETPRLVAALQLFEARGNKDWSLVDCLSFTIMTSELVTGALTADHHFEQAGFSALLRHAPPAE